MSIHTSVGDRGGTEDKMVNIPGKMNSVHKGVAGAGNIQSSRGSLEGINGTQRKPAREYRGSLCWAFLFLFSFLPFFLLLSLSLFQGLNPVP